MCTEGKNSKSAPEGGSAVGLGEEDTKREVGSGKGGVERGRGESSDRGQRNTERMEREPVSLLIKTKKASPTGFIRKMKGISTGGSVGGPELPQNGALDWEKIIGWKKQPKENPPLMRVQSRELK